MRFVLLAAALFAVTGQVLADGYSKYYRGYPDVTPEMVASRRAAPPPATPQLMEVSDNPQDVVLAMARRGYAPVGFSSFTSGWKAKPKGALKQGKKVKADLVVVIDPRYERTVAGAMPLTMPTTSTTHHTGTATAYGSGGSVTAYGSGTSTTYGSKTTYIPYSIDRYEYGALYFVKLRYSFGVHTRPLEDSERQRLQSNSGAVVTVVVENTPAYLADVLPGDILLRMNDQPITTVERFSQLAQTFGGQAVEVLLMRGDQEIRKTIQLQ